MLSWKMSVLEIPLDKELTANCLVETRKKLEELIPAAMVKYSLNRVQLPLWLKQSLINGFSWWFVLGQGGQRTSVKCAEAAWNYKAGGIVHLKSPAFFVFVFVCLFICLFWVFFVFVFVCLFFFLFSFGSWHWFDHGKKVDWMSFEKPLFIHHST